MQIRKLILLTTLYFSVFSLSAKAYVFGERSPRLNMGVGGGLFRLSIANFENYYGSRLGVVYAGHLGYALSSSSLLLVKGRYFTKGNTLFDPTTGQHREQLWEEKWLCFGYRHYSPAWGSDARSFFGMGLVFFFIDEKKDGTFLLSEGFRSRHYRPRGFYISTGYEHYLTDKLILGLEIELSSAGLEEGNTLESQSVGGIYVGGELILLFF